LASELLHDATLVTKNMFLNTMKEVLAENTLSKGCVAGKRQEKSRKTLCGLGWRELCGSEIALIGRLMGN
jgi:hypothetical protein